MLVLNNSFLFKMDQLKDKLNNARLIEFDKLMSDVKQKAVFDKNVAPKDKEQVLMDLLNDPIYTTQIANLADSIASTKK